MYYIPLTKSERNLYDDDDKNMNFITGLSMTTHR